MAIFDDKIEIRERCKGVHCVDLGESFPTSIYLQNRRRYSRERAPRSLGENYSILFIRVLRHDCAWLRGFLRPCIHDSRWATDWPLQRVHPESGRFVPPCVLPEARKEKGILPRTGYPKGGGRVRRGMPHDTANLQRVPPRP